MGSEPMPPCGEDLSIPGFHTLAVPPPTLRLKRSNLSTSSTTSTDLDDLSGFDYDYVPLASTRCPIRPASWDSSVTLASDASYDTYCSSQNLTPWLYPSNQDLTPWLSSPIESEFRTPSRFSMDITKVIKSTHRWSGHWASITGDTSYNFKTMATSDAPCSDHHRVLTCNASSDNDRVPTGKAINSNRSQIPTGNTFSSDRQRMSTSNTFYLPQLYPERPSLVRPRRQAQRKPRAGCLPVSLKSGASWLWGEEHRSKMPEIEKKMPKIVVLPRLPQQAASQYAPLPSAMSADSGRHETQYAPLPSSMSADTGRAVHWSDAKPAEVQPIARAKLPRRLSSLRHHEFVLPPINCYRGWDTLPGTAS